MSMLVVFQIQKMDMILGAILKTLQERNLENVVDFILTSDHGMTSCNISDKVSLFFIARFHYNPHHHHRQQQ